MRIRSSPHEGSECGSRVKLRRCGFAASPALGLGDNIRATQRPPHKRVTQAGTRGLHLEEVGRPLGELLIDGAAVCNCPSRGKEAMQNERVRSKRTSRFRWPYPAGGANLRSTVSWPSKLVPEHVNQYVSGTHLPATAWPRQMRPSTGSDGELRVWTVPSSDAGSVPKMFSYWCV